jgi:hypothetical protein
MDSLLVRRGEEEQSRAIQSREMERYGIERSRMEYYAMRAEERGEREVLIMSSPARPCYVSSPSPVRKVIECMLASIRQPASPKVHAAVMSCVLYIVSSVPRVVSSILVCRDTSQL